MGLVEADTPVIPEYFVHKLSQLGTSAITVEPVTSGPDQSKTDQHDSQRRRRSGSLIGLRSPSGLWNFLNGRLRLMARMRKEAAEIQEEQTKWYRPLSGGKHTTFLCKNRRSEASATS